MCITDEVFTDAVEYLREHRRTAEAIFVKFTQCRERLSKYTFCFYEGEDGKYYDTRIRNVFGSTIVQFAVGNRDEVIKLLKKINYEQIYNNESMMFFIDRDMNESLWGTDDKLYETPCYSIENLYCDSSCFEQIIQTEFGVGKDHTDFSHCMEDYIRSSTEFTTNMIDFNAIVLCRCKKKVGHNVLRVGAVKTSKLIDINVGNVTRKEYYFEFITQAMKILRITSGDFESAKQELIAANDFQNCFRGKNQLDFLQKYIDCLKKKCINGGYFSQPLDGVKITITNNRLSELNQYALTPRRLFEFLEYHKTRLN
jgi:hypothetical protein